MFPIIGDIRRDLYTFLQRAHETVLERVDYDSHVTPPHHHVPGNWLHNALEFSDPTIQSTRGRILIVKASALIQGMDQV